MEIENLDQQVTKDGRAKAVSKALLLAMVMMALGLRTAAWSPPLSGPATENDVREEERLNRAVASAINTLGVFLFESGRLDEAETQFREALRYSADDARARNNLAMVLFSLSRFKEMLELYPEATADEVSDPPLLTALAVSFYATGAYEEAVPYFERLHDEQSTKPELEVMLAVALDLTGAKARSKEVLNRLGSSVQVEAGYHVFKGDALRDQGQVQEAIVEYEKALTLQDNLPNVPYRLGVLYSDLHQYEDALRAFQKELALNPANADASYSVGAYYLIWGQDLGKARQFFQQAINSDSKNISGYLGLMKVCLAEENPDCALDLARKAEEFGLEHPELFYLKARAFRLKGEDAQADEALHRFEELKSTALELQKARQ